jgi:hypothetical protein
MVEQLNHWSLRATVASHCQTGLRIPVVSPGLSTSPSRWPRCGLAPPLAESVGLRRSAYKFIVHQSDSTRRNPCNSVRPSYGPFPTAVGRAKGVSIHQKLGRTSSPRMMAIPLRNGGIRVTKVAYSGVHHRHRVCGASNMQEIIEAPGVLYKTSPGRLAREGLLARHNPSEACLGKALSLDQLPRGPLHDCRQGLAKRQQAPVYSARHGRTPQHPSTVTHGHAGRTGRSGKQMLRDLPCLHGKDTSTRQRHPFNPDETV